MKTKLFAAVCAALCTLTFCACKPADPYKNYSSSGIITAPFPYAHPEEDASAFGYDRAELFTDYESFAAEELPLDFIEDDFEHDNLLVFTVHCCSSDEMEFGQLLISGGKIYPLFYRNYIPDGAPVTDDFIVLAYYSLIPKISGYTFGKVIFRYR